MKADTRRVWMGTRNLLIVTAVIEMGTGLALTARPSAVAAILLGSSLDTPAGLTVGRVAGIALVSLGLACWLTRDDGSGRGTTALVASMLFYNVAVAALLAIAGIVSNLIGVALLPAVALHAALAVWCVACVRDMRPNAGDRV